MKEEVQQVNVNVKEEGRMCVEAKQATDHQASHSSTHI
jgi:hypothetical protein